MTPADGLHHPVAYRDYAAWAAYGSGSLKSFREGPPARVLWERDNHRADTDATILGSAVDCALTERDQFEARYCVKPEGLSFASKEGKAWRDDPARAGKILLSHDVGAKVAAIRAAVLSHEPAGAALSEALYRQASILWTDPETEVRCKGRPDWFTKTAVYDLKVTRFSGPGLGPAAFRAGWFHQLAHYRAGLGACEVGALPLKGRIVAVHPEAPHYVWTVECDDQWLDFCHLHNVETLRGIARCEASGEWPGTPQDWTVIRPPEWAAAGFGMVEDVEIGEEV